MNQFVAVILGICGVIVWVSTIFLGAVVHRERMYGTWAFCMAVGIAALWAVLKLAGGEI